MTPPVNDQDSWTQYLMLSGAAFCASFLRYQRWQDDKGRIVFLRVIAELATSVALGVIAAGVGSYYKLDIRIVGAIAAALGLLGPAFMESLGQTWLRLRIGGQTNAEK